ncbi:MAG: O-antigen ligase family protein [Granulosicoccus sp.]|nr:O-antigen ligase family protein [Granulosicoccus sp.]
MTILMGIGVLPTIAIFFGGLAERLLTPLWLLLYVSAFLGLMFTHGINWISWLVRYRILLVLLILGTIMSVSWSVDAGVSAERTVHLVGSTLLAIYIGFSVPLLTTLRVFAVVLAIAMLGSIGVIIGVPELGIEAYEGGQVWRGLFSSKNDIGFWAATGVLLYVTLSDSTQTPYRTILCFLMAGVCLAILPLSQSATSMMAMLVAGALSLYLFIASRFQLGFFRMAFVAVLFVAVIALAIANIDTAELIGRSGDLTGRSEVWRQVWRLILERPLTGVGYGSLWFPTEDTLWIQQSLTDFTWVVYHAHNGLLQIASEVGIPLALIALLMVAQQLIEIFYCQYERQQVGVLFVLAFVVAYLISNYSEARFLVTRELFWIFFLALPISMLRQINLVSADTIDERDAYADVDARTPYGSVPGKPWLGPLPHELRQQRNAQAGAAVGAGAAMLSHLSAHDSSSGSVAGGGRGPDASSRRVDVDLAGESPAADEPYNGTVSLPGVDARQDMAHDETHDLTDADALSAVQKDLNELRAPIEHDSLHYDDSLDVDRYDMEFDLSGEWVDIDLDDEDEQAG